MAIATINDVADYVIVKLDEARAGLNILKLQKLLYYVQAWHLALKDEQLFAGRFQAWVHGPVNREIYDRFSQTHMMYAMLSVKDISENFDISSLPAQARAHVDEILDAYAPFSGPQLEAMTHEEEPWIRARGDKKPSERCEDELDEGLMRAYYKKELAGVEKQ